ncbi:MAG TPA: serine/threonine protein kinase, partial [Nannocystis exedens]|nr:serine/threonine protein kinase [Nannocystis exedens]
MDLGSEEQEEQEEQGDPPVASMPVSPGELSNEMSDEMSDEMSGLSSDAEALRDAFRVPAEDDDAIAARARAQIEAQLFGGAPPTPAEPELVGRYRIEGQLGAGGMGVVYRAYDPELDRRVAVKLLREDTVADERARQRMLREARSMARLAHPNVIHVYDVGIVGDQVFVAMELVIGVSLGAWLMSAPRPWQEVLDRFLAAGEGLHAAHVAGLIHRDFKPENVLVAADGRVRVLDFGLARSAVQVSVDETPAHTGGDLEVEPFAHAATFRRTLGASLTRTGALLGTPRYMSPELCLGRPADARSDLFAFCVALYEGLYGRAPFKGDTVEAYLRAVVAGEVCEPPKDDNSVPPWIWPVLERGLAADPEARYADMSVLLAALRRQEPSTKRGLTRPLLLGAGLVVVLGLGLVALGI